MQQLYIISVLYRMIYENKSHTVNSYDCVHLTKAGSWRHTIIHIIPLGKIMLTESKCFTSE